MDPLAADMDSSELSSAPSSPLSSPGSTPSPPPEFKRYHHYPSPPTSQGSQHSSTTGTPAPDGMDPGASTDKEGGPPAKRRRISRERTTEHLDLTSSDIEPEQQPELDRLLHVLHHRQKIVVIAGAGISVSAGIPDFRSSTGLFKSLKGEHKLKGSGKHLFDASVYKDDTSTTSFHQMVSEMSRLTKDAKPTAFHHMLATIAKEDRLLRLYTQNIDGIDTSLEPLNTRIPLRKDDDGKWPRTVQLHGGLDRMVCSKCHDLSDFKADLFSGPVPPLCSRCEEINDIRTIHEGKRSHGIGRLRPRMVLYNEHNPDDVAIGTVTRDDLRKRPDAIIVAGTGLDVPGVRRIVREMCGVVRGRRDGVAIWVNKEYPQASKNLEDCFDIIVQGTCDEVANRAAMRRWDEPTEEEIYSEISDEEARKAGSVKVEVQVQDLLLPALRKTSPDHANNSFRAPVEPPSTPRTKIFSPAFSPITSRNNSIIPSIETDGDNIDVKSTGLLTPTKSHKSSRAKKTVPSKSRLKLNACLQSKQSILNPHKPKPIAKTTKKPNVKYIKPAKFTTKAQAKTKTGGKRQAPGKVNMLTNSFTTTKTAMVAMKKSGSKITTSPSKLRPVSNTSTEPMHPVSPSDPRNNTSPSKKPFFPGLTSENPSDPASKKLFT